MRAEHARDHGGGKAVAISLFQKCTSPPADTPAWLEAAVSLATLYLNTDRMTEALDLYPLIMTTARTTLDPCTCAIVHGNWALAVLRGPLVNKDSALRHLDSAVGLLQCHPTDVYGELMAHVESERAKAEAWLIEYDAVKAAMAATTWKSLPADFRYGTWSDLVAWGRAEWAVDLCARHSEDIAEDSALGYPSWTREAKAAEMQKPCHRFIVASDGIAAIRFEIEFGAKMGNEGHVFLWDLHVGPTSRGKGLGSRLLTAVEGLAREAAVPEVRLQFYYRSGNNKFYKARHGYKTHPTFAEKTSEFIAERILPFEVVRKIIS